MLTVRNLLTPYHSDTNSGTGVLLTFRELMLIAGYIVDSDDGHASWANSEVLVTGSAGAGGSGSAGSGSDFSVNSASPRVVYDPDGRFTQSMADDGNTLSLLATNDQNRSAWKIEEYIDANNVRVDIKGFHPSGWITESNIPARILARNTSALSSGSWMLFDAPAGSNMQVRILHNSTTSQRFFVRPRGKLGAGAPYNVETNYRSHNYTGYNTFRLQAYADGASLGVFYKSGGGSRGALVVGELENTTDTQDANPGFVWGSFPISNTWHQTVVNMLNHSNTVNDAYIDFIKRYTSTEDEDRFHNQFQYRLVNGNRAPIRRPNVMMSGTNNVYPRGKMPFFFVQTYTGYESERPINSTGTLYHFHSGIVIPRNGPNDQLLLTP